VVRRLLIVALIFGGVTTLADRGTASFAASTVATSIQRSEDLEEKPGVAFRGFPFLTQAIGGEYDRIDIDVRDYRKGEVRIRRIQVHLQGVHLSLGDALSRGSKRIPVDHGEGTVTVAFADVNDYLARKVEGLSVIGAAGAQLLIRGSVDIPGLGRTQVEGEAVITVRGEALRFVATKVRKVGGASIPPSASALVASRLSFDLPTAGMPFGITLKAVRITADSVEVDAAAEKFVIQPLPTVRR
jgi:hypothetical protein